jgi:hypothetical protein
MLDGQTCLSQCGTVLVFEEITVLMDLRSGMMIGTYFKFIENYLTPLYHYLIIC